MQDQLYKSYLMRIWCDSQSGDWRATLQNVLTQEVIHFSTVELMFNYLCKQVNATPEQMEEIFMKYVKTL